MRLIDADVFYQNLRDWRANDRWAAFRTPVEKWVRNVGIECLLIFLHRCETVDAEPVRHGRWIDKYGNGDLYCSECGAVMEKHEHINHNLYFCYHCGAKMDEEAPR